MPAVRLFIIWDCSTTDMEKIFSWKVLVSFCAVFILAWVALQTVSNMRLEEEAKIIGSNIFFWEWPGENWKSQAEITTATVIKKSDNDAVIKISGKQLLTVSEPGTSLDNSSTESQTVDCTAVLTLYRQSGNWVLGRVEL